MVKRRRSTRSRKLAPGFKRCLISKLRGSKIKTAKQARRAFSMAAKKCRKAASAKATKKCKYGHRKGSTKCLKKPRGRKGTRRKTGKRNCKYGVNKKTHRCLKHKR